MTEYNVGDLVEISKGDVIIRDRLAESLYKDGQLFLPSQHTQTYVEALAERGWAVTVIEKAAPKLVLPIISGFYIDKDGGLWTIEKDGKWRDSYDTGRPIEDVMRYAPFTRLERVPVTAAKVIAEVRSIFGGPGALLHKDVDKIAERYGVSS